jgi:hypothetical protein
MANLGWRFYMINASWNVVFLLIVVLGWVETRGLTLEDIALKFEGIKPEDVVIEGVSNKEAAAVACEFSSSEKSVAE